MRQVHRAGEKLFVGAVYETIEQGVGQGGVADRIVPGGDRQLARHDGRAPAVAIFENRGPKRRQREFHFTSK
jgi:hypothetical protein